MLEPVTKKFQDDSNLELFRFTFFCDSCGKAVKAVTYRYKPPFKPKLFLSASERRAREILWLGDHSNAYERANKEALIFFNRCPVCGRRVCDDCFADEDGICLECKKEKTEKETFDELS